jgi:hypothetical protein
MPFSCDQAREEAVAASDVSAAVRGTRLIAAQATAPISTDPPIAA